jgi:hypothetical protein
MTKTTEKEVLNITKGEWSIYDMSLPARGIMEIKSDGKIIGTVKKLAGGKIYSQEQDHEASANANAICTAVNETYGKGYNPAAMHELYEKLYDVLWAFGGDDRKRLSHVQKAALAQAEAALNNAKI